MKRKNYLLLINYLVAKLYDAETQTRGKSKVDESGIVNEHPENN